MMTSGPAASIGEVVDVRLARPRRRLELVDDRSYDHARAAVLEFPYARHAAPALVAAWRGSSTPLREAGQARLFRRCASSATSCRSQSRKVAIFGSGAAAFGQTIQ